APEPDPEDLLEEHLLHLQPQLLRRFAPRGLLALAPTRASGGIGRRAGFRILSGQPGGGSTPPSPTTSVQVRAGAATRNRPTSTELLPDIVSRRLSLASATAQHLASAEP